MSSGSEEMTFGQSATEPCRIHIARTATFERRGSYELPPPLPPPLPVDAGTFDKEEANLLRPTSPSTDSGLGIDETPTGKKLSAQEKEKEESLEYFRNVVHSRKGKGPAIKVWFAYFDKHHTGRTHHKEFVEGMTALGGTLGHDIEALWSVLDYDGTDVFFLDEFDPPEAVTWSAFQRWCGRMFSGPRDFIRRVKSTYVQVNGLSTHGPKDLLTQEEVTEGLRWCGWEGGSEEMLFAVMASDDELCIGPRDVRWLDRQVRIAHHQQEARKRMRIIIEQRAHGKQVCRVALKDFKIFLRHRFGGVLFRAWRRVLDVDGTMTLQRSELFKAARQLNWRGNVRFLWRALDHDGGGNTTLEEFDPLGAQVLAQFREWAVKTYGPQPSSPMFHTIDKQKRGKLEYAQFIHACEAQGFHYRKAQAVASCFDWQDKKHLLEADFALLDHWKPPAWLVALPNAQAASALKQQLLNRYQHYVKAWKSALDRDNSSSCNWHEFCDAAKHVKFVGDVAGAWRSFDSDYSGVITLQEIDKAAYDGLMEFKLWADEEFGGVKAAFKMMDTDKSQATLSFREFKCSCCHFGFTGNPQVVFQNLCYNGKQDGVKLDDVAFLDSWETPVDLSQEEGSQIHLSDEQQNTHIHQLSEARRKTPGPGAYDIPTGFAARPKVPVAKHNGSFSFGRRYPDPWTPNGLGPAKYRPKAYAESTSRRKPAFSFGNAIRAVVPPRRKRVFPDHLSQASKFDDCFFSTYPFT